MWTSLFLLVTPFLACGQPAVAQDAFNLDDTGEADTTGDLDYIDLWPAKIVLDPKHNQFKLVWFETDPPRHTDIYLADIERLKQIPAYEGYIPELQILLKDGRTFLLDLGASTHKTAQTFAAMAGVPIAQESPKSTRLVPKPSPKRANPTLVIGDITSPDTLLPPSTTEIRTAGAPVKKEFYDNSKLTSLADRSSIDLTVNKNMARFLSCYRSESKNSPNLMGRVDVTTILKKDGTVKEATVSFTSLDNSNVERCLVQQMMGMQFETQGMEDVNFVYPFVFSNLAK